MTAVSLSNVSFAQIRSSARVVAERAAHVGVLTKKADELAATYAPEPPVALPSGLDPEYALDFLVVRATLRFGSGYEPRLALAAGQTAADNLDAALAARFAKSGPIEPRDMSLATSADLAELRGQSLTEPPQAEFLELQTRALRDLGRFLIERHEGSCARLLESAQGSAARLCETIATIPFFHDSQRYRGMDVAFFHRAQRLVLDLADAAESDGLGRFDDAGDLAPSSDAECVLALRAAGVLAFDEQLRTRLENGEIVPVHSEREVELRACALHAATRITTAIQAADPTVGVGDVDRWLRARAAVARKGGVEPHRTRTIHY